MSERHSSSYSHKSSRRHKEDSSKSRSSSKRSHHHASDKGIKTPPLPANSLDMEELLRKKRSLQQELRKLEKHKDTKSKHSSRETSHHRHNHHTEKTYSSKNSNSTHVKHPPKEIKKPREKSPEYQNITLDSEDEEDIIEQRRKRRKQLIEKLATNIYPDKTDDERSESVHEQHEFKPDNTNNNQDKNDHTNNTTETKERVATDMFSEKDDFFHKNDAGGTSKDEGNTQLIDNWDDSEGYYNIRPGDVVNKRYTIKDVLGQGVFANVVRAQDAVRDNSYVAIKIVRNNDLMYKTSLKEIALLKEINDADPDNKYHCVKFIGNFMHKGHLCLVLESLHMDLRAVLKKYGKHHGIHTKALMSYSRQLLLALRLLKKIGIIHADIKPDNILVNEKKNILKLCDFGSAAKLDENEPTPYLVSRFYRAPEIILGIPYSHGIDIWSTACTIYEMATGTILFTGSSNNRMLKCFMDLKGKIPSKLIRKGKFKDQHFNYNNNFMMHKKDEFSGRDKFVEVVNVTVVRELQKELVKSSKNLSHDEEKKLTQLKDLLDRMLIYDPNHRYTVSDCLRHSFIQEVPIMKAE